MDLRPKNCRFRLQDEGRLYPRSRCEACGRGIASGLGKECADHPKEFANGLAENLRQNSQEYDRAIKDAVLWLVQNNKKNKPEFLAEMMADDLLSQ